MVAWISWIWPPPVHRYRFGLFRPLQFVPVLFGISIASFVLVSSPAVLQGRSWARATTTELANRDGSVCLNAFRGGSKWIGRSFQAAAGIGVARLVYA